MNATYADAPALGLLRASNKGNAVALREVREAIEGKVVESRRGEWEIVACLIALGVSESLARAIASGEGLLPQFKG